jgi:hypothetical protein
MDLGGNLKSSEKNSLLSLEKDIFWPSDESGHVSFMLDGSSNSEVSGGGFEKWVSFDSSFFSFSSIVLFFFIQFSSFPLRPPFYILFST